MSQRSVERVIGRLITDESYRLRFAASPEEAIDEMARCGIELTEIERRALLGIDIKLVTRVGESIDPHIQKVCGSRGSW
jgi:hypothetical protein